jgi:hypothetical protein
LRICPECLTGRERFGAFPDVTGPEQFVWLEPAIRQAQGTGECVVGYDPIEMYERMRALMGHHKLTELFGGGTCFWNTVDIQWPTRGLGT